jgi:hypothetical protein
VRLVSTSLELSSFPPSALFSSLNFINNRLSHGVETSGDARYHLHSVS